MHPKLKEFFTRHKKVILTLLAIYLILTAILIFGSFGTEQMAFRYQMR